jgi:hypothetical protein
VLDRVQQEEALRIFEPLALVRQDDQLAVIPMI